MVTTAKCWHKGTLITLTHPYYRAPQKASNERFPEAKWEGNEHHSCVEFTLLLKIQTINLIYQSEQKTELTYNHPTFR